MEKNDYLTLIVIALIKRLGGNVEITNDELIELVDGRYVVDLGKSTADKFVLELDQEEYEESEEE